MNAQFIMHKGHFIDEHGNIASLHFWGSIEEALKALESLHNCTDTIDCSHCDNCHNSTQLHNSRDCNECDHSSNLERCDNIKHSTDCVDCSDLVSHNHYRNFAGWTEKLSKFISKYFTRGLSRSKVS